MATITGGSLWFRRVISRRLEGGDRPATELVMDEALTGQSVTHLEAGLHVPFRRGGGRAASDPGAH